MPRLYLPPATEKNSAKAKVAKALTMHFNAGADEHRQQRIGWTWAQRWINGQRSDGPGTGVPEGIPTPTYRDARGRLRVRWEKCLPLVKTEVGRIMNIDIAPAIERRRGVGLGGLREESLAQAACEFVWRRVRAAGIPATDAFMTAVYGPCGLAVVPSQYGPWSWIPTVEIVPGWELRPLPAGSLGKHEDAGLIRFRWVPYSWLKRSHPKLTFPKGSPDEVAKKLGMRIAPPGSRLQNDDAPPSLGGLFPMGDQSTTETPEQSGAADEDREWFAPLREYMLRGDSDSMERYVVMVGDEWVASDIDFTTEKYQERLGDTLPVMPIHVDGYMETASFYPRSFLGLLMPLNRESEYILGDQIDGMRKMAKLRKLLLPASSGVNIRNLKAAEKESVAVFQPDYMAPSQGPMMVEPPPVSREYGPLVNQVGSMLMDLASQGPLFQGRMPNRADSALAAQVVGEYQDVPLAGVADLKESAWAGVWRACHFHMRTYLNRDLNANAPAEALINLSAVDESALGLRFDPQTGTIDLSAEMLCDPHTLGFSIRNRTPRPKQMILQLLREEQQGGRLTLADYEIACVKEGLDLPMVSKASYYNYETAWLENCLLFGDGRQSTAKIDGNALADNHSIHLVHHMALAQSPPFRHASDAVQTVILQHIQWHKSQLSNWTEAANAVDQFLRVGPVAPGAASAVGLQQQGPATMAEGMF